MKSRLLFLSALILTANLFFGQNKAQKPQFDREKEKAEAIKKGMHYDDIDGYLFAKEREFYDAQDMAGKTPVDPYAWNLKGGGGAVISGAACVNASFENSNFGNWTGSTGNSNTCGPANAQSPNYTQTGAVIVSPAGANAGLTNAANYHTVMNIPATNPNYPNCNQFGYDSIAVRAVGSTTVSDIPHVCPYYTDGNSVRMNGAIANYRACKLRYNFALTPFNRNITYAFALVFYGAHAANQQPYFKVSVLDQNNNPVGGTCGVYNVNGSQASTDTSFKYSVLLGGNQILYRKWRQYGVDLSSPIYATVTAVNLEFTVGGCCYGGHWGYAYVDAECSQGGTYSAMCAGTNSAVLTAPLGYIAYQWYSLPGMTPMSPMVGGNTPSLSVNPAIVGQVFQVKMTTPTGCTIALNDTVKISGVNITAISSKPTCIGGSSGSTSVSVQGSNTGYNFTWVNSSNAVVSTSATANNLPPGVYTVSVTAISCGIATSTVAVGVAPPTYYQYNQNFCGSLAVITATTGSGYVWYNSAGVIASNAGQQSLVVNNPVNNSVYTVVYTTPQGCKDSVRYTLKQIAGGSIYVSNVKDICPTSPPVSYGVVNLNTIQSGPYSYTVTGTSYNHTLVNTPLKKDSLTGLAIGTYSVTVFDGACFYNTTFSVTPYNYSYTVTPTNSVLCVTGTVPMGVSLSNTTIPTCGGAITSSCANPKVYAIGNGTVVNSQWGGFPCVYGAYYDVCRHQLLFTAADLAAAGIQPGQISSMQFLVNNMLPLGNNTNSYIGSLQGFEIKMKCTPLTVLNNVWDNVGFTTVFNPTTYTPSIGWNNHTFNTPFNWDGTSGILVDICFNWVQANPYTSNPNMPYTNTGVAKTRYYYSSNQALCGLNTTCYTTVNRPNVRLGNCAVTKTSDFTYAWTPNYALSSTNTQSTVATPSTSTVYSITVNPIGQLNCAQTQTVDIQVIIPVTPTITSGAFCTNFAPTAINVTPNTGTWTPSVYMSGGGVFTASLAAIGSNTVSYTTGSGTCTAASTLTINVEQYNPATLTGSVTPLCITDPTVNLMSIVANTTGTWTGVGVNSNVFDPNLAGTGIYNLSYNTNSVPTLTLCPDVSTLQVHVHSVQQPTLTQIGPYCNNMAPSQIQVAPTGGVFGGQNNNAVSATGLFDPQLSIIGGNTIGYTVTSGPCVKTETMNINVEKFIPATLTSSVGPYCWNDMPTNLNGIVMATGGTWSGAGIVGGNFDPSASGAGNFVLTYATHSSPTASLCPDASTIAVLVNPKPIVSISTTTLEGCNPLKVQFEVPSVNDGTGNWNFGDTNYAPGIFSTHTYTTPGTYFVTFDYWDNIGCYVYTQYPNPVIVRPVPVADFDVLPDYVVSIADATCEFKNKSTVLQNNTYFWNIANYKHSVDVNTNWTFGIHGNMPILLAATNEFGCTDTIVKIVTVKNDYGLWIPNSFTPNGDGLNDEFRVVFSPYGLDYTDFELDIFDRWGEKIFSTKDILIGWNGGKLNKGDVVKEDTYVYKIRYKTAEKEVKYKTGHVTLIK